MQYFVIGPDGSKFGPADLAGLRQWMSESRLGPSTILEDVTNGQRLYASALQGLFPAIPSPNAPGMPPHLSMYQHPPLPGQYPRYNAVDAGGTNLTWSFVCFGVGALFTWLAPIFCSIGIVQAHKARARGSQAARVAKIMNIVMLSLGALLDLVVLILVLTGNMN